MYHQSVEKPLIDASTPFGKRVLERLEREPVIWLTTTGRDGTPQPNPVWFLWDDGAFLIYSLPDASRVRNLERSPRVALHFDTDGQGGDVAVFTGEARIAPDEPPSHEVPAYQARYERRIRDGLRLTPEQFASRYSLAIRVTPTRLRGF